MTSSSPSDEPTFYARSATLESPRPIHIPEPSNIPVLENQIDPIFNLMTTHLPAPHATRNMTAIDHEMASLAASSQPTPGLSPEGSGDLAEPQVVNDLDAEAVAHGVEIQAGSEAAGEAQGNAEKANSTIVDHQTSSLTEQLPVSLVALGDSSSKPVAEPEAAILSPPQSSMQKATLSPEQSQAPVNGQQPDGTNGVIEALTGDNQEEEGNKDNALSAGVNLEALLNNIATTSDTALAAAEAAAGAQNPDADAQTPNDANPPSASLPSSAGLPPRPPPQEKPAIHPNYAPTDDIRSFHFPNLAPSSAQSSHSAQSPTASNSFRPAQLPAHLPSPVVGGGTGSNGLPPPPMASFQQPQTPNESKAESNKTRQPPPRLSDANATSPTKPPPGSREDEDRWPAEIQAKYNQFLRDEEEYTKEGTWDKFPQGSRLFIGNLPTEVVTKRDIFHIFHRYGRLAQISIKQAYGFVQFMETKDCQMAIQTEQNGKIKDRSMHLEISKPPKSSRGGGGGREQRGSHYRRSRSPEHGGRNSQRGGDRHGRNLPFSDFRDEPRRRDDYRPGRSPSPRGFRGRDDYRGGRDRSPDRYFGGRRERSRSPYGRGGRYGRSPSPKRRQSLDEDDALPLRRRDPHEVPDVQIILIDDMDAPFVQYVEKQFNDRGLRVAVLRLMPNMPLNAVVRRQIYEGVVAVVQLYRAARASGKIPLKVFDRSAGINNVRFEEYENLDAYIAAEVANQSKIRQAAILTGQPQQPPQQFAAAGYPPPQTSQQQQQASQIAAAAAAGGQPNLANLITSLDGPALQKLLGAMQQQSPQGPPGPGRPQQSPTSAPDLAALLGSVNKHAQPPPQQQHPAAHPMPGPGPGPGYPYAGAPQPQMPTPQQSQPPYGYGGPAGPSPYGPQGSQPLTPHGPMPGQPAMGFPGPQHPQQQMPLGGQRGGPGQAQPSPQQVQSIMAQLARWKQ